MNLPLKFTALATSAFGLFGATAAAHAAEYANVVSATPVTSSFPVSRQECADAQRVVPPQPSGGGALVGAIIGGVIGNQFGHGFGRAAATGLGAVAGSAIGNNVEANATPPQAVPVRQCRTVNGYETRVVGYDVVYEYHGQRYSTRLPNDPGPRLAIDVRPSNGYGAYDEGAARGGYGAVPPAAGQPSYEQAPPTGYPVPPASSYYSPAPVYAPAPVYYPAPAYYYGPPRPYYAPPVVSIGVGTGWGRRHGYRHW